MRSGRSTTSCWSGSAPSDYANVPGVGLCHRLADLRRGQGLDVHHHRQVEVAGRVAAHGQGRRLHLQLHPPQRASACSSTTSSSSTRSRRPIRLMWCSPARSPRRTCWLCIPILPDTSGAKSRPRRSRTSSRPAADHRLRAVPDGRVEEGRVRAHGRQQGLLARAPKVDEVIFQTYQNQDTMAQDLKTGASQSGWNVPRRSSPR